MSDQADYRTSCSRCRELEDEVRRLRAEAAKPDVMGLWPFQPSDADDECVFCARKTFEVDDGDTFCDGTWRLSRWWCLMLSCPDVPHIHRHCECCGASWLQRTRPVTGLPGAAQ